MRPSVHRGKHFTTSPIPSGLMGSKNTKAHHREKHFTTSTTPSGLKGSKKTEAHELKVLVNEPGYGFTIMTKEDDCKVIDMGSACPNGKNNAGIEDSKTETEEVPVRLAAQNL